MKYRISAFRTWQRINDGHSPWWLCCIFQSPQWILGLRAFILVVGSVICIFTFFLPVSCVAGNKWDLYSGTAAQIEWKYLFFNNCHISIIFYTSFSMMKVLYFCCPFRWWVGIFIQEGNKESTSTFLKPCLFLSFSLCFGACSSLFRVRYVLPYSLCVGTVSYGSYVPTFEPCLESVAECLPGCPKCKCTCSLHLGR